MAEEIVKITQTGIDAQRRRLDKIAYSLSRPPIHKMVQGMAGIWQSNFESEGGAFGGWRQLAPETQDLRQSRGYDREHPILVQSGSLKRAAITGLLNVNGPRVLTYQGVMMSYRPSPFGANLEISGPKVDNQFRMRGDGFSQPARPFWFVNPEVEQAASDALHKWLKDELGL